MFSALFNEAKERIEENTGATISKKSVEDVLKKAPCDFDDFYEQKVPPPNAKTGPILIGAIDCKGIPMVKEEEAKPKIRQKKGENANKKNNGNSSCCLYRESLTIEYLKR
ncbi:MAG: hypothetical protein QME07_07350 [bacterium]|nr:hypothetical protein [bacterium]